MDNNTDQYVFSQKDRKRFSIIARFKSMNHAWRGLQVFLKTGHNAWVQIVLGVLVVILGFVCKLSGVEWALITLSIFLVLVTEAVNTAIEIDIDLTSPEYHPYARDTKDVAAGAVVLSVIGAGIVGLVIFVPKIVALLK